MKLGVSYLKLLAYSRSNFDKYFKQKQRSLICLFSIYNYFCG